MQSTRRVKILELDALRGIAALVVVLSHMIFMKEGYEFSFGMGYVGVAIFFFISGFVINMSVEGSPSASHFMLNRVSRLYPAYWFSVLLIACIGFVMTRGKVDLPYLASNATMFQYWMGVKDLDGSYWTMRIELCFYFIAGILLWAKKAQQFEHYGAGILLICFLLYFSRYIPLVHNLAGKITYFFPLFTHYYYFYAGVVFYAVYKKGFNLTRISLLIACFAGATCDMGSFFNVHLEKLDFFWYEGLLLLTFFIFLLLVHGKLSFLNVKPLLFLGEISYSLYITHFYISYCFLIPVMEAKGINWIVVRIITLSVIFALAVLTNKYVEVPMMHRLRKLFFS